MKKTKPISSVPEIAHVGKKPTHHLAESEVEIHFLNSETLRSPRAGFQTLQKLNSNWTETLLNQLEEKIELLYEGEKPETISQSTQTINLHQSEGGNRVYLFLNPKILNTKTSAIQNQEFLRKNIQPFFKRNREEIIRINLTSLELKSQKTQLELLTTLLATSLWKSPTYGIRIQKDLKPTKPKQIEFQTALSEQDFSTIAGKGLLLGEAMNTTRTLGNTPGNYLTPKLYVDFIKSRMKDLKNSSFDFLSVNKLKTMRAGAFLAVCQGSANPDAGIVHLTYSPKNTVKKNAKNKNPKKIALVGKGLCFDTGGINLKPHSSMLGMHRDMLGSAVVFSLFEALAQMECEFEVHAFLALAENHISNTAFKPNDVVTAYDGTTIEINHTDAEGRMVLADTLSIVRKLKPNLTLDFATLTGSAVRAIGTQRSALFSNRPEYLQEAHKIGEETGERVWGFPIGDEYAERLKSDVADTLQCIEGPADHILAATFLSRFIGDENPWIHIDLSADCHKGGLGLVDSEVTAFGVRLGYELIHSL